MHKLEAEVNQMTKTSQSFLSIDRATTKFTKEPREKVINPERNLPLEQLTRKIFKQNQRLESLKSNRSMLKESSRLFQSEFEED